MLVLMQPVMNPAVPYMDTIIGGLQLGSMVTVTGNIHPNATDFAINFALGNNIENGPHKSAIALHFNPRLNELYVARNSFQRNKWANQESANPSKIFPFQKGLDFEVIILVAPTNYMIAVNGKHFCTFIHRISFQQVNTLHIRGDINLQRILLSTGSYTNPFPPMHDFPAYIPSTPPPYSPPIPTYVPATPPIPIYSTPVYFPPVQQNIPVPFERQIPGGMRKGTSILITGQPKAAAKFWFNTNMIMRSRYGVVEDDIAFHISVRYPECVVVRNTLTRGDWGSEERSAHKFPFQPNVHFTMQVVCEQSEYVVIIDGQHFCTYRHRLEFSGVDRVGVTGEVTINSLTIN